MLVVGAEKHFLGVDFITHGSENDETMIAKAPA